MQPSLYDALPARPFLEIAMSKGNRGNKEAKKPKQAVPALKSPAPGGGAPTPASGAQPPQRKK
jgi:hypothetical protein